MSAFNVAGWTLAIALLAPAIAPAAIFSHVDVDSGLTILNNVGPDRPRSVKTVSASPVRASKTAAPSDFPRVSAAHQQAMDGGRRAILMAELSQEQQALDAAAAAGAQAEVLHRHQANIAALQRELRATR